MTENSPENPLAFLTAHRTIYMTFLIDLFSNFQISTFERGSFQFMKKMSYHTNMSIDVKETFIGTLLIKLGEN